MSNERTIEVTTRDGRMETFIAQPDASGAHPVVLLYMDAPGIREELREMARRMARRGYYAMLPNLFYRAGGVSFDPSGLPDRVDPRMQALNFQTRMPMVAEDTQALLDYIETDSAARNGAKGCIGFCMGGRHACTAAGVFTHHFRAAASVHGGFLVTGAEDSAHLKIPDITGEIYFAFADHDPTAPLEHMEAIEASLRGNDVEGHTELHRGALHGFAFPERYCYDENAAEAVWRRWFDLLDRRVRP